MGNLVNQVNQQTNKAIRKATLHLQWRGSTKQTENPRTAFRKSNGLTRKQLKTNQWFYKYLIFHSHCASVVGVRATYLPIFPQSYLRTSMRKQMNQTLIIPIKGDEGVNQLVTTLFLAPHKLQSSSIFTIFSDIPQHQVKMGIINYYYHLFMWETEAQDTGTCQLLCYYSYYDPCSTSYSTSLHSLFSRPYCKRFSFLKHTKHKLLPYIF